MPFIQDYQENSLSHDQIGKKKNYHINNSHRYKQNHGPLRFIIHTCYRIFLMLQSNSKEERKKGDFLIQRLNQINMTDEEPILFTQNYQNQNPNDTPQTHQLGSYTNYSHHQDYDQIDGFFDFCSNTEPRVQEEDVKPIEPEHPREDKEQRSLTFSEMAEITMANLDSPVTNIEYTQINEPLDQQRPAGQQEVQGQNRFNHSSQKNIIGYIAKKAIKRVLKKYRFKLMKACKDARIQFRDFQKFYEEYEKKLYGPEKLAIMLRTSEKEKQDVRKMKMIFHHYFIRVLRRDYLTKAWKSGKMVDMEAYLCKKNNYLLYFAESISAESGAKAQ